MVFQVLFPSFKKRMQFCTTFIIRYFGCTTIRRCCWDRKTFGSGSALCECSLAPLGLEGLCMLSRFSVSLLTLLVIYCCRLSTEPTVNSTLIFRGCENQITKPKRIESLCHAFWVRVYMWTKGMSLRPLWRLNRGFSLVLGYRVHHPFWHIFLTLFIEV